jgi:hypothetical protein
MFKLLPQKHNLQTKNENQIIIQFGKEIEGKFYGYTTYKIDADTGNKLLEIIPKKYRNAFEPSLISMNIEDVVPHIDNEIKAVINFYVDTADGITRFHKIKPGVYPNIEKLSNQTDGALFKEEDLEVVDSFKAEQGDIYVLDIKQIHSVKCTPNATRNAYCLKTYKYSFNEVVNILKG